MTNKSANDMKNPKPLNLEPSRKICPVCGEPSYSREGVHPQCSAAQTDTNRVHEAVPHDVVGTVEQARALTEEEVSLPIHPYLLDSEVARVVQLINEWRA